MRRLTGALGVLGLGLMSFGSGCVIQEKEDSARFREAIPEGKAVELLGPETAQAENGSQSTTAGDEPWADGPWAKYYGLTRTIRKDVNQLTGAILGSVWIIVHTEPTTLAEREAIWGPWTDSLEPATYRFRVTEVGEDEYDYALEGRPKGSNSDADYRAVLSGKGWGRGHAKHGDGYFSIDLDAAKTLDPFEHQDDSGTIKITHDLPDTITSNLFRGDRFVRADVRPSNSESYWSVDSTQHEDGTGNLVVNAFDDVSDDQNTQNENVQIVSRWKPTGAGRADITLSGGDVPADPGTVTAVECWDADFYRSYYSDSYSWEPAEGSVDACVFSEPPKF